VNSSPSSAEILVGRTLDSRYVIEAVLGEGGMGIVYRGRHKVIDKQVAIKVLRGEMASNREMTDRFLQEARAASRIGNPHIVDISDFGELPDGSTYFVMEYLDGRRLSDLISDHAPLPAPHIRHIAKQIAQGLAAAHASNIVHRDLKPDNVMLVTRGTEKDFVKILDFGIAKVGGPTSSMKTRAGSVFGTPHYMSPEQAAGLPVDLRTDVYALGVILYEMASGKVPFDADNFMGILTQHMYKSPVPVLALVPHIDIPPGFDAVIQKCLTKKPDGRYASMDEIVADLELLEHGQNPGALREMMERSGSFHVPADYFRSSGLPPPVPATPGHPPRRWPVLAAVAAGATIAGLSTVILMRGSPTTAQPSATAASVMLSAAPSSPPVLPSASPSPIETKKLTVVTAFPKEAVIKRGTETLKNPAQLLLTEGETVDLVISSNGYQSETVALKGGDEPKLITLTRQTKPVPVAPVGPRPAPTPPVVTVPTAAPTPPRHDPDDPFTRPR
jgi:serine/threonine-protein kinase